MVMAAQMGLKPREIRMLTLRDFNLLRMGHNLRMDDNWNYVRTLMSDIRNTAFGSDGKSTPKKIMPIPSIDFTASDQIKTKEQADKFLKTFF